MRQILLYSTLPSPRPHCTAAQNMHNPTLPAATRAASSHPDPSATVRPRAAALAVVAALIKPHHHLLPKHSVSARRGSRARACASSYRIQYRNQYIVALVPACQPADQSPKTPSVSSGLVMPYGHCLVVARYPHGARTPLLPACLPVRPGLCIRICLCLNRAPSASRSTLPVSQHPTLSHKPGSVDTPTPTPTPAPFPPPIDGLPPVPCCGARARARGRSLRPS